MIDLDQAQIDEIIRQNAMSPLDFSNPLLEMENYIEVETLIWTLSNFFFVQV